MADVFISYSKMDRLLVEKLAADLEANGWSTWFDRGLTAGDAYRDEIAVELANARAVVVVWTENSITSDFVRAEAGRAKADNKLIPVKNSAVDYQDIPLPFGEMHTEPVENGELVRAAVVGMLARPITPQSFLSTFFGGVRREVLTWLGIVGASITVFSSMKALIEYADWIKTIADHWNQLSQAFWTWVFLHLSIAFDPVWTTPLTFTVFILSTFASSKIALLKNSNCRHARNVYSISLRSASVITLITCFLIALQFFWSSIEPIAKQSYFAFIVPGVPYTESWIRSRDNWLLISTNIGFILPHLVLIIKPALLVFFSRDRPNALIFLLMYLPISSLLSVVPLWKYWFPERFGDFVLVEKNYEALADPANLAYYLMFIYASLLLAFVSTKILVKRFIFISIGICIMIAINQLAGADWIRALAPPVQS